MTTKLNFSLDLALIIVEESMRSQVVEFYRELSIFIGGSYISVPLEIGCEF